MGSLAFINVLQARASKDSTQCRLYQRRLLLILTSFIVTLRLLVLAVSSVAATRRGKETSVEAEM